MGHVSHSSSHTPLGNTHFKSLTPTSPSGIIMAPTIKFRAKNRDGKLVITVVSCTDLPDADAAGIGFGNKSDPYVIVRVGGEEQKTKALSGKLNPEFKKETSTFVSDDLIGKASIKLTSGQANGVLLSLSLQIKE